jgi:hypothetical protein
VWFIAFAASSVKNSTWHLSEWQCLKGKNDNQERDRKSKDIIAKGN